MTTASTSAVTGFTGQFATTGHGFSVVVVVGVGVGVRVVVGVCFADTDLEGADWQAVTDTANSIVKIVATAK